MNSTDIIGYIWDADIYCDYPACLPEDAPALPDDRIAPIFCGAEFDYIPVCAACHNQLGGYQLTDAGRRQIIEDAGQRLGLITSLDADSLPAWAWPGGYPILYQDRDGDLLCAVCATEEVLEETARRGVVGWFIHHEGPAEMCTECGAMTESAYGDPDEEEDN